MTFEGKESLLPHGRLLEVMDYSPGSGELSWKKKQHGFKNGRRAGYNHTNGYRMVTVDGIAYLEHRLIWFHVYGEWPKDQIDHINHSRRDNRLSNLREARNQDNARNFSPFATNTSGHIGVCKHKHTGRWQATITVDRKQRHLGLFDDIDDAVSARKTAESELGFHENHGLMIED